MKTSFIIAGMTCAIVIIFLSFLLANKSTEDIETTEENKICWIGEEELFVRYDSIYCEAVNDCISHAKKHPESIIHTVDQGELQLLFEDWEQQAIIAESMGAPLKNIPGSISCEKQVDNEIFSFE